MKITTLVATLLLLLAVFASGFQCNTGTSGEKQDCPNAGDNACCNDRPQYKPGIVGQVSRLPVQLDS